MRSLTLVLVALAAASPLQAQQWSATQQEVIDFQQRCWDLWMGEDIDGYITGCPTDGSYAAWGSDPVPNSDVSEESLRRSAAAFWPAQDIVYFELRPVVVRIVDDVATMFYWASWTDRGSDGSLTTLSQKRLDVMIRRGGSWARAAAMTVPDGG